ncbi:MAG: O-antigen polymerase [Planctomycetota bacterium]
MTTVSKPFDHIDDTAGADEAWQDERHLSTVDAREMAESVLDRRDAPARSWASTVMLAAPCLLFAISYLGGGIMPLNTLGMTILALVLAILVIGEFVHFSTRFGIGAIVVYGGVIIWMLYDYMYRYAFADSATLPFGIWPITKACVGVGLFALCADLGMRIPWGRRFERRVLRILPEPESNNVIFGIAVAAFLFGISPYFLFTAEPFYMAMYNDFVGGYAGGAAWTVGRTGNVNYSFGGYIAQMMDVGTAGALLAVCTVLMRRMGPIAKMAAFLMMAFWILRGFGSGARGNVIYLVLPAMGFFFLRQHIVAAWKGRRFSPTAYGVLSVSLVAILLMIAYQGALRGRGFRDMFTFNVSALDIQGNEMFSASLEGYTVIPDEVPYFYSNWPGENIVRPAYDKTLDFVTGPIPRAIWRDKPIDPVWLWYNEVVMNEVMTGEGFSGTTISQSYPGHFFFRYGYPGVIEGALAFGFFAAMAERLLRASRGRLLAVILALGLATFLFRCYRDPSFQSIYPLFIGMTAISLVCLPFARRPYEVEPAS